MADAMSHVRLVDILMSCARRAIQKTIQRERDTHDTALASQNFWSLFEEDRGHILMRLGASGGKNTPFQCSWAIAALPSCTW